MCRVEKETSDGCAIKGKRELLWKFVCMGEAEMVKMGKG